MDAIDAQSTAGLWRTLAALATVTLPGLGWLGKSFLSVHNRLIRVETQLDDRILVIDRMKEKQEADSERLVKVEEAVLKLADMQRKTDDNYSEIKEKMEILPRIDESLKYLARVCATIVPRDEWELNNKLYDERLKRTEDHNI